MNLTIRSHRGTVAALALAALSISSLRLLAEPSFPAADSVSLRAADAVIMGTSAKLNNDLIEAWNNPNDVIKWTANIPVPGIYNVIIEYGYADGSGALMEVAVGDQAVRTEVMDTLGWENIATVLMGEIEIKKAGPVPVNLTVLKRNGYWIMNLRGLRLDRTSATSLQDPPSRAVHPAQP